MFLRHKFLVHNTSTIKKKRSTLFRFLIFETSIFPASANSLHTMLHSFLFLDRIKHTYFRRLSLSNLKNSDHVQSFQGDLLCEKHVVSVILWSAYAAHIVHTVFIFSNHQTECGERWFLVSRYSSLSSYN